MSIWIWVMSAVALDGAAGLAGAFVPERWLERYRAPTLALAAVALLISALAEILPDAFDDLGLVALVWSGGAFAALAMFEWASARSAQHSARPVAPVALLGSDALHNVGDGMAIAAAFLVSRHLGVVTAAAVIVHEVPEEIADYAVLHAAGVGKRTALVALAAMQLTAGIGAAGTLVASSLIARGQGLMLAIAGGTFVYIAVVDLVPAALRARAR